MIPPNGCPACQYPSVEVLKDDRDRVVLRCPSCWHKWHQARNPGGQCAPRYARPPHYDVIGGEGGG